MGDARWEYSSGSLCELLPKLSSASSQQTQLVSQTLHYKSGARFEGHIESDRKVGRGAFIWPNGARYDGQFVDDERNGKGKQQWPDGDMYIGNFVDDMRHGEGVHRWANGERYTGQFFKDRRHGQGSYTWKDGSSFEGMFYMERKEGYGAFDFANGTHFMGLYKADEREGPGVLSYDETRRQDVGLWRREDLVRLCVPLPGAFSLADFPEYSGCAGEERTRRRRLSLRPAGPDRMKVVEHIIDPPKEFRYEDAAPDVRWRAQTEIFSNTLHSHSLAWDLRGFDDAFNRLLQSKDDGDTGDAVSAAAAQLVHDRYAAVWNKTPSCVAMQKHVLRYKANQNTAGFPVKSVLFGKNRSKFGDPGLLEVASAEFHEAARNGDCANVDRMLNAGKVYVDVADLDGNSPLLAAAVNWHLDVINSLLDNGANVNRLNDEGVSALSACHVTFYPRSSFQYNSAESGLTSPDSVEQEPGYDVAAATVAAPSHRKGDKKKTLSEASVLKIEKLREEFESRPCEGSSADEGSEQPGSSGNTEDGARAASSGGQQRRSGKRTSGLTNEDSEELMDYLRPLRSKERSRDPSEADSSTTKKLSDFQSNSTVLNYPVNVSNEMIERCATHLSTNDMVVSRQRSALEDPKTVGTARALAIDKSQHELMQNTMRLLLRRGADPNASEMPMPVIFFAIKACDVEAVKLLLLKGASTTSKLPDSKGGLTALHIACAMPGEEGVQMTELLLDSLADPDARAVEDDSYLNTNLLEEWGDDDIDETSLAVSGGRTPLHIACARQDNYKNACRVVKALLKHHANPDVICNGQSPLTLAIISGNDLAVDELLGHGVNASLPLTKGVGSALCVASNTDYEGRRSPEDRLKLIDKLMNAGADILATIAIGPKRSLGTVVDYAYYMYNLDRRIAHMPYHALSSTEREVFNARRALLEHMGHSLRSTAVQSPQSAGDLVCLKKSKSLCTKSEPLRYCYECGRSVNVKLSTCTRCKQVFYCSKACKMKAWNARHRDECVRIGETRSRSKKDLRSDSPTPGTDPDVGRQRTTVAELMSKDSRVKATGNGRSKSADATKKNLTGQYDLRPQHSYTDNYSFE